MAETTAAEKHLIDIVMIPFDNSSSIYNIIKIDTLLTQNINHKKASSSKTRGFLRFRTDSNRCTRFCRPLPSHSATEPDLSP
jgi:hypothetical protein